VRTRLLTRRRTKRQTREAIYGLFPNANLQARAGWLNENIDKTLSEV
jgi:chitin synthase